MDYSEVGIIQLCLMGQYYEFMMLFHTSLQSQLRIWAVRCQQNLYVCDYIETDQTVTNNRI